MHSIGGGIDRQVYLISPDKVMKVAKRSRGIVQNSFEGIEELVDLGLQPKVFYREDTFVVCERVNVLTQEEQKHPIFTKMTNISFEDFNNRCEELREMLKEIGCEKYLKYNLHKKDFCTPVNWGMKDGQMMVIDGGVFMGKLLDELVLTNKELFFNK